MEKIKNLMVEYILTNGNLPGFDLRLDETLQDWETSTQPFLVYRGHGHLKKGIKKPDNVAVNQLKDTVRPIISTSKDKELVIKKFTDYAQKKEGVCCFFEITVEPGIRFIDFTNVPTDYFNIDTIRSFMDMKKELDPENKHFPSQKFPYSKLLDILKTRKDTEKEILLDGMQGTFIPVEEAENKANNGRPIRIIKLKYLEKDEAEKDEAEKEAAKMKAAVKPNNQKNNSATNNTAKPNNQKNDTVKPNAVLSNTAKPNNQKVGGKRAKQTRRRRNSRNTRKNRK